MTLSYEEYWSEFEMYQDADQISPKILRHALFEKYPNTMVHIVKDGEPSDDCPRRGQDIVVASFNEESAKVFDPRLGYRHLFATAFELEDGTLADGDPPIPFSESEKNVVYNHLSREFLQYLKNDPVQLFTYLKIRVHRGDSI